MSFRYMRSIFAPYCTIVEARDGLEALDLCASNPPDLIISDVMMPNVDLYPFFHAASLHRAAGWVWHVGQDTRFKPTAHNAGHHAVRLFYRRIVLSHNFITGRREAVMRRK